MLQAASKEKVIVEEESLQDYERRRKDGKVKNWNEKALHGAFVQQISDEAGEEQTLKINSIKYSIDKISETPLCRLRGDATETVRHIVRRYKKLAQSEYRKRHDKLALTSLEMYNYRPSLELFTCYGKCSVSKLRGVAETQ